MLFHEFVAIIAIISAGYASANKFNVSLSDLNTCKQYNIDSKGYTYADFFELNDVRGIKVKDNERMHLKFYVMTSMDAHILLAEDDQPHKNSSVYEIVLGAGSNSYSIIRLTMGGRKAAMNVAKNLLSLFDPMPVEIIQRNDGTLVVNIPNFIESHLTFKDANPLNIRYVSFSSYDQTIARWFYGCEFDGFSEEMEMASRPVSDEDRLTADLMNTTEMELRPSDVAEIAFSFKVRSVTFDQRSSILNTRLHLVMSWIDNRLKWDPNEYGNISVIVKPLISFWHPVLNIADGALDTFMGFKPFYSIKVKEDGNVTMFARNAEMSTWCFDVSNDWPNDVIDCDIVLNATDINIKLAYDMSSPLTNQSVNELSEWKIQKVSVLNTDEGLVVRLRISHNSVFYHCIFSAPALVTEALILLAFFLEKNRRGGLILVGLVVVSLAFMFVAKHAPIITFPDIVIVYNILMMAVTGTYCLHILTIWLEMYPPKVQPHRYVFIFLNWSALRFVLAMKFQDSSDYLAAQEHPWGELSKILNRITFVVLAILFICINTMI